MDLIAFIIENIYNIDSSTARKYMFGYIGIIIFLSILIQVMFILKSNKINKHGILILEKKNKIKQLIDEKNKIDELKDKIDNILKKEIEFKLKDYIMSFLQQKNFISNLLSSSDIPKEEIIKPGYREVSMDLELQNLSTMQIIEILSLLEENLRVYLKDVELIKSDDALLKLKINIAALELA